MRAIFMGTPDFAVPTLAEILGAGHEIPAVYTQPPRRAGRGMAERPSPVERFARASGLPVRHPQTLRDPEVQHAFAALEADVAVVVAYGLILPPAMLQAPRLGCFNLHASLLPRWRGAAPIQRAIMAGDRETGVTVMRMDEGLDTGDIGLVERVPIGPDTTAGELHDTLAAVGASLMVRALAAAERDALEFRPQPEDGVTYAAKIDKAETRIDWREPASRVHDRIRGLSPQPGAWFEARGQRIKVLRSRREQAGGEPGEVLDDHLTVACGEDAVRLLVLQRQGRSATTAEEFLRGFPIAPGTRLG